MRRLITLMLAAAVLAGCSFSTSTFSASSGDSPRSTRTRSKPGSPRR